MSCTSPTFLARWGSSLVRVGYGLCCLWLGVALVWAAWGQLGYSYPFWYQQLHIGAHLDQYASLNADKPGFEQLPETEHLRVFAEIAAAVHGEPRELAQIRYQRPDGHWEPVLNAQEVGHLTDVAWLLERGRALSLVLLLPWLLLAGHGATARCAPSQDLLVALGLCLPLALWLLLAGPVEVFYQFHRWLFPPEHPWFFYWEDSLMSSLMKAPLLFGPIALGLCAGGLALMPLFWWLGRRLAHQQWSWQDPSAEGTSVPGLRQE